MNTESLQLFIDVANLGSFANAARKHQKDPSKISRDIANLEEQLNITLFKRSTRALSLTQAGERYLGHITPIIDALNYALEDTQSIIDQPSGILKISASISYAHTCVVPLLDQFMQQYPDIHIELRLSDHIVNLHNEDIDLAFRLTPSFESDLIGIKLQNSTYHVCASPSYLNSHLPILQPADLQNHQCLVFTLPKYRSRWLFKNANNELEQIKIQSKLAISNALTLKKSTLNGLGLALLPNWVIKEEIEAKQLNTVLNDYQVTATDFETAVWMLYPSRKYLPQKVKVFIDFMKERLKS